MLDTVEKDRILQELEHEREARRQAELEVAQARLRYQVSMDECNRLRSEADRQRLLGSRCTLVALFNYSLKLRIGCRVVCLCRWYAIRLQHICV